MEPYKIIQWLDENIMAAFRGADVLFLTPCRDYAVLEGRASNNPSMGISTGNSTFDASFFGAGFVLSAGLDVLRSYMQRRNERLQLKNKDYFLQKLIYLYHSLDTLNQQHNLPLYSVDGIDPKLPTLYQVALLKPAKTDSLEKMLYYHGDHVIGPNQWYRRHFKAKKFGYSSSAESSLALLKEKKEQLIHKAMQHLDQTFQEEKNRHESEYAVKQKAWQEAEEKKKKYQQNLSHSKKIVNGLWTLGDIAWSSLFRYMLGYWVVWYAVWAITGLTAVTSTAAIGFSFGLPLIPVGIYVLYRALKKNDNEPKSWEYFYHREIFIKMYFVGLNNIVKNQIRTLSTETQEKLEVVNVAQQVLDLSLPKEMNDPFLPPKIYRRALMTTFASNLMSGLILTEFGAWPIVAFLTAVGVAAAGGPLSIAIIAGAALAVGLFMAVRKTYLKHKEYSETEKLRAYHEYVVAEANVNGFKSKTKASALIADAEQKCDKLFKKFCTLTKNQEEFDRIKGIYDDLKQIAVYEEENKILENALKVLYCKVNEDLRRNPHENEKKIHDAFKPIEALSNISRQERFYRRMSLETTPRTTLKKTLHAAFVGVSTGGTGILFIRLFFGLSCVFALHNPMFFVGMAIAMGLIWSGYKVYEHLKDRQDHRDKNFVETRSLRLMASKEKNEFLRNQYNEKNALYEQKVKPLVK